MTGQPVVAGAADSDCNFIIRMLYSDMYWLTLRTLYCFVFASHVQLRFDISVVKQLRDREREREQTLRQIDATWADSDSWPYAIDGPLDPSL